MQIVIVFHIHAQLYMYIHVGSHYVYKYMYVSELQKSSLNYFSKNKLSVMAMVVTIMPFGRTLSLHSLYIDACEAIPPEMCFGSIFGCRVLLFLIVPQVSNCTPKP